MELGFEGNEIEKALDGRRVGNSLNGGFMTTFYLT
jgi:hypothetical protein